MKLTSQNGRKDASGLHNDRNFDLDKADHINSDKVSQDRYWTYTGEKEKSLRDIELDYYKEHFTAAIKEQNKKNRQTGHRERDKTLKQYYSAKYTRPEDRIIQIGDKNEHPDSEELWEVALEYQKRFNEIFGSNCRILDMSLHLDEDEGTPHVHIRRVWVYEDENGMEKVGQGGALDALGILRQDPEAEAGQFNNAKITFTAQDRQLLRDICMEKDIELEPDEPAKRKHMETPEFKKYMDDLHELERQIEGARGELEELGEQEEEIKELCTSIEQYLLSPAYYNIHDLEVAEARKKSLAKRAAQLTAIMKEEAAKVSASEGSFRAVMEEAYAESHNSKMRKEIQSLKHKVEILNQFVVNKGLGNELVDYLKDPERKNISPHRTILNQ